MPTSPPRGSTSTSGADEERGTFSTSEDVCCYCRGRIDPDEVLICQDCWDLGLRALDPDIADEVCLDKAIFLRLLNGTQSQEDTNLFRWTGYGSLRDFLGAIKSVVPDEWKTSFGPHKAFVRIGDVEVGLLTRGGVSVFLHKRNVDECDSPVQCDTLGEALEVIGSWGLREPVPRGVWAVLEAEEG